MITTKNKTTYLECSVCEGMGYVTIPAHQEAGYVVDETEEECECNLLTNQPNETQEWVGDDE